jgi:alpha-glucosidase
MHDVLRFWLDRGVDGFRADVIHLIGKDPDLPDDPPHLVGTSRVDRHDEPATHELLRRIRKVVDGYPRDRMVVGEVNLTEHDRLVRYYGTGDELHLVFNFIPMAMPWQAGPWREHLEEIESAYRRVDAWPAWVLSNHDIMRHRSRLGSEARARAAALLLLTLRGTPFLYAGEELGLEDAHVPAGRRVDPGGRDGCRAPLPWEEGPGHGWASAEPWLPWPPDAARRCVARQRADAASILHLYRRLLAARRASPALHAGSLELVDAPDGVLAYRRVAGADQRTVAVNFSDAAVALDLEGTVDVSSRGGREDHPFSGLLAPDEAVVIDCGVSI